MVTCQFCGAGAVLAPVLKRGVAQQESRFPCAFWKQRVERDDEAFTAEISELPPRLPGSGLG